MLLTFRAWDWSNAVSRHLPFMEGSMTSWIRASTLGLAVVALGGGVASPGLLAQAKSAQAQRREAHPVLQRVSRQLETVKD